MLVLTRKLGEGVQLGPDITIWVSRVDGNQVRLALDAPREVAITRVEKRGPEPNNSSKGGNRQ